MVEIPFFDTDPTSNFILETGYEDAWSNSRGWPFTATFHEGRLYFGGSASLPSSLFFSMPRAQSQTCPRRAIMIS